MKFILRSLVVLTVAIAFGAVLYFAVRALPSDSPKPPPNANVRPESGRNLPQNPPPRTERSENNRNRALGWRLLLGLGRRIVVFSMLIFAAVLGKDYIFKRKPNKKKTAD